MRLEKLTCNCCGAPIEVPSLTNFVTCNHCSTQLTVKRTENATFTQKLDQLSEKTEQLSAQVAQLSSHSDLAALDREWELERENYMVSGKNGHRHLPTELGAVGGGIMITLFGCFWTAMAFGITSSAPDFGPFSVAKVMFPLFGVIFVLGGIGSSVWSFRKAGDFREAQRRYERRRQELLDKGID